MLLYILSRLGSICQGLASAEAWHAVLYLITPWQYLPRLGILFYIITPWQYLLRLGILFYILSSLGSIHKRTNLQKAKLQKLKLKIKGQSLTAKAQAPKTRATKAQVEQTETCRRAGVRDTL